jgi:hypothetical protein
MIQEFPVECLDSSPGLYNEPGFTSSKHLRGDRRPGLSGGAKLRWSGFDKHWRASLDQTAEDGWEPEVHEMLS